MEHDHEDATREVRLPDRHMRAKGTVRGRGTERMIQSTTLKPQRRTKEGAPVSAPVREWGEAWVGVWAGVWGYECALSMSRPWVFGFIPRCVVPAFG